MIRLTAVSPDLGLPFMLLSKVMSSHLLPPWKAVLSQLLIMAKSEDSEVHVKEVAFIYPHRLQTGPESKCRKNKKQVNSILIKREFLNFA